MAPAGAAGGGAAGDPALDGGRYEPSLLDRAHYHVLIAGDGTARRGPRLPGQYLPHTRNLNTGSVGLAICAMAGAVWGRTLGTQPFTRVQWERAAQAAAELCAAYDLDITERTVLCHSEVGRVYGKQQRGKWDIDVLPFETSLAAADVHDQFRRKVTWFRGQMETRS